MTDHPTPDQGGQPPDGLQTSLPDYPDTRIAWIAPAPERAASANATTRFVTEDGGTPFVFAWDRAVLFVEDIDSARVLIVARADIDRNGVEVSLYATNSSGFIPIGDVDRLIERYHAFARGTQAGAVFREVHRRGWAGEPDAIDQAVNAIRDLEDKYDKVTDTDVIAHLHTSRATFYRKLDDEGLQFDDIRRMAREEGPE